jgi:hypothetical protein
MLQFIGGPQLLLILLVPIGIFILGFYMGKKSGYIKRLKETENQEKKLN